MRWPMNGAIIVLLLSTALAISAPNAFAAEHGGGGHRGGGHGGFGGDGRSSFGCSEHGAFCGGGSGGFHSGGPEHIPFALPRNDFLHFSHLSRHLLAGGGWCPYSS